MKKVKEVTRFDLAEASDEIAKAMEWNCIAIPANDDDDMNKYGIIIGTKEWVNKILEGEEEVVVLTKDFSKIVN